MDFIALVLAAQRVGQWGLSPLVGVTGEAALMVLKMASRFW